MNPFVPVNMKAIVTAVAALVGVSCIAMTNPAPATAATLGPVGATEFGRWCNVKHRTNVLYSAGPLNLWDAYSWRCTLPPGIPTIGVDANAACTLRYGSPAYSYTTNPKWAHSWMCRR